MSTPKILFRQTYKSVLLDQGWIQSEYEHCCFYHPERNVIALVYVDDILMIGEDKDIDIVHKKFAEIFECKPHFWRFQDPKMLTAMYFVGQRGVIPANILNI